MLSIVWEPLILARDDDLGPSHNVWVYVTLSMHDYWKYSCMSHLMLWKKSSTATITENGWTESCTSPDDAFRFLQCLAGPLNGRTACSWLRLTPHSWIWVVEPTFLDNLEPIASPNFPFNLTWWFCIWHFLMWTTTAKSNICNIITIIIIMYRQLIT